jgi:mRNA-degrading endonuclease RelE of RelBE toxin-antitoxin system
MRDNPSSHGVEKLHANVHRVRVGDWRVIYVIDDDAQQVTVERVKRRNERTYR